MPDLAALIERAPRWLRRWITRTLAGQGFIGSAADAVRFRYSERDIPEVPPLRDADIRLLIGPANEAGQGAEWGRAVESYVPRAAAVAMRGIGTDPFQPRVDLTVPVAVYQRSSAWHGAFEEFLREQTHVIWESGFPLLGRRYRCRIDVEIEELSRFGVRGALLFHGSDIRPPTRHARANPWSPFSLGEGITAMLEEIAAKNSKLAAQAGVPVFVTTPDLLQWVPGSVWCPVVVDSQRWQAAANKHSSAGGLPVVVHAPSNPWIKGTDRIEPVLRRLEAEGLIEYRQIVGVPHAAMPDFYAAADIVLDQFRIGSYGIAACEAMAAGRLVMGHIDQPTRQQVKVHTGLDLPIHEATIDSLEQEIRQAVADPDVLHELRAAGPRFVDAVHSGKRSVGAMSSFLGLNA